jgi:ABC-type lipopolysaccharide export system ATPase subunit
LPNSKTFVAKARKSGRGALFAAALVSALLLPCAIAVAQVAGGVSPVPQQHRLQARVIIDDRVRTFAKNLDLNEAQQSAVKRILEERQQETLRIRLDPSLSGEARFDRFRALQDITVERIRSVLNDEQKKKYDPLVVRKIKPAPQERSVEDWLKATTRR